MPADDGKESCPGDKIELAGDDLEIAALAVGDMANAGSVLRVAVMTDSYSNVRARQRNCLGIYRRRVLWHLGTVVMAAVAFLTGLIGFIEKRGKPDPKESPR